MGAKRRQRCAKPQVLQVSLQELHTWLQQQVEEVEQRVAERYGDALRQQGAKAAYFALLAAKAITPECEAVVRDAVTSPGFVVTAINGVTIYPIAWPPSDAS